MSKPTLEALFPTPAGPPNAAAPARWSGITPKSVEVLKKVLKDSNQRWHIFHNDVGYMKKHVHVLSYPDYHS